MIISILIFNFHIYTLLYWSDSDEIMSMYSRTNALKESNFNFMMNMLQILRYDDVIVKF